MVHPLIEKNKRILGIYGILLRLVGWILLPLGGIWLMFRLVVLSSILGDWSMFWMELHAFPSGVVQFILFGLLAIGLAQFIRCLLQESPPGKLLRCGPVVLYVYAILSIVAGGGYTWANHVPPEPRGMIAVQISLLLLFVVGKAFIFIGLGRALRQILPIIEESRTLV